MKKCASFLVFFLFLLGFLLFALTESHPATRRVSSEKHDENNYFGLKTRSHPEQTPKRRSRGASHTKVWDYAQQTPDRGSRRRKRNEKFIVVGRQNVTQVVVAERKKIETAADTPKSETNVTHLTDNSVDSSFFNLKRHHPHHHQDPPTPYYSQNFNIRPHHRYHGDLPEKSKAGDFLGQLVRLLLEIPSMTLAILKPFIIGVADTTARVTHGAAGVSEHLAQYLPAVTDTTADIGKKLIETAGDAGTTLFNVLVHLTYGAAAAQRTAVKHLPHTLTVVQEMGQHAASALAATVKGVADTTHVVTLGALEVAKIQGNLVSNLINHSQRPKFKRSQEEDHKRDTFDLPVETGPKISKISQGRVRRLRKRKKISNFGTKNYRF